MARFFFGFILSLVLVACGSNPSNPGASGGPGAEPRTATDSERIQSLVSQMTAAERALSDAGCTFKTNDFYDRIEVHVECPGYDKIEPTDLNVVITALEQRRANFENIKSGIEAFTKAWTDSVDKHLLNEHDRVTWQTKSDAASNVLNDAINPNLTKVQDALVSIRQNVASAIAKTIQSAQDLQKHYATVSEIESKLKDHGVSFNELGNADSKLDLADLREQDPEAAELFVSELTSLVNAVGQFMNWIDIQNKDGYGLTDAAMGEYLQRYPEDQRPGIFPTLGDKNEEFMKLFTGMKETFHKKAARFVSMRTSAGELKGQADNEGN